ncbi:MAG: hypothetical protein WCJ29_04385 [bacterium]
MKQPVIFPALADLRDDIAGPIPVDLIRDWINSNRSPEAHAELLKPFTRRGIVGKSDSAGLSKLTSSRSLIEVLKLVNDPKEIIAAHGCAIGGEMIGTWIADDTQMFYPEPVTPEKVVEAMVAAQNANAANPVKVGLALHSGEFYHIGGGLYGEDAELVEALGEDYTEGGEIAITNKLVGELPDEIAKKCTPKNPEGITSHAQKLNYTDWKTALKAPSHFSYPAPFAEDLAAELHDDSIEDAAKTGAKYLREETVVLVRFFHEDHELLLNHLAAFVAANSELAHILKSFTLTKIKSNGQLGIFTAKTNQEATSAGLAIKNGLTESGWQLNVSCVRGPVYIFPMKTGFEIAGAPVNICSKLAEDTDKRNCLFIEKSAADGVRIPSNAEPFSITKSGVTISGFQLSN